jgi:hypothetical protein
MDWVWSRFVLPRHASHTVTFLLLLLLLFLPLLLVLLRALCDEL